MVLSKWPVALALIAALLLAGCEAAGPRDATPEKAESGASSSAAPREPDGPAAEEEPEDDRLYTVTLDRTTKLVFDAAGNEIPPEKQFTVLYEQITGQPQCQKRTITEDTGEDNEYGGPVLRRTTALYDMEGKLLYDYSQIDYDEGFGDFLIRHDDRGFAVSVEDLPENYHSELWNYKTGMTVLEDVAFAWPMDEEKSLFLMADKMVDLLGVTDARGNVIGGFPPPEGYYTASRWNGMVIASDRPSWEGGGRDTLLTKTLTPVVSRESFQKYGNIHRPFLLYRDGDAWGAMDREGKEYRAPEGEEIDYFDGELAVLGISAFNEEKGYWTSNRRLVRADGTELAAGYEQIENIDGDDRPGPARLFVARRKNTVELLDRDGKVLRDREIPGLDNIYPIGGGLISCTTENYTEAILTGELEMLIEPGIYYWIRPLRRRDNGPSRAYDLLEGAYYLGGVREDSSGGAVMRRDVLDLNGRRLVTGLTSVDDVGPNRLAVQRGFSAGLMDWQGNWIVKKSIFQKLNDDYDPWGDM